MTANQRSGYPSGLTASAFEALIHYYYTPVDLTDLSAVRELIDAELAIEVSAADYPNGGRVYQLTDRGRLLAEHIVNLPLPCLVWQMPKETA